MTANPTEVNTEHQSTFPSTVPPQLKEVRRVQGFRYSSEVTCEKLVSTKKKWSYSEAFHKQEKKANKLSVANSPHAVSF